MPKCFYCNNDVHPGVGQCPQCGAPIGKPTAELEREVRSLLDQGRKIEAVKLYKDQTGAGLAAAKDAVEAMHPDASPPLRPEIGGDVEAELLRLLGRGEKLAAVKRHREQTGVALVDAKQAVESLAAKHGLEMRRSGCLGVLAAVVLAAICVGMMIR